MVSEGDMVSESEGDVKDLFRLNSSTDLQYEKLRTSLFAQVTGS
jgi:hypothetical protein